MRCGLILILLLIMITTPVWAEDTGAAGQAIPVLRFGVGAKFFAMGSAGIAIANDATAVYWNPAGLASQEARAASAMHSELFMDTKYDYLGLVLPVKWGALGFGYLSLVTTDILTSEGNLEEAAVRVYYFGYGYELWGWQVGVTGKYVTEELPVANRATAWSLDLGLQKQLNATWRVALVVQDLCSSPILWNNGYEEGIPVNYKVGLSYQKEAWLFVLDGAKVVDLTTTYFGLEYTVNDFLKLRGGFKNKDLAAGMGLKKNNWLFDYAYSANELGNTHRFSLGIRF